MQFQKIPRVAVFVILAVLSIVSAGWFRMVPSAWQETATVELQGEPALVYLKESGQFNSLQAAINEARFSVDRAEATPLGRTAWRAPNPEAGYDAYVTEEGVSIAINKQSYVSLSLNGLGYGAAMRGVAPGKVSGDKQSIRIARESGVQEWYLNSPEGLEHGFTLSEPPGAKQPGVPLRLAMQVSAGWRAEANDDGKTVMLRGADEQAIEYGKLIVRDKSGLEIPARLKAAVDQVVIEVEDDAAEYPLTIDPLFTLQQRLTAADGAANDYFGYSVALDGNTALVGAPYADAQGVDRGVVYVFVRNGATWTLQETLKANDGADGDKFGFAVALDGDTAIIGSPQDDIGGLDDGSAYVFVRSGTTWTQQQKLLASGGFAGALFGAAVAVDGNTVLVGAYQQTITPSFFTAGAAYVFVRNGTTWTLQQRLLANDADDNDRFGFSVALDGDTALIGAPGNTVTVSNQGAAYIFTRNGTIWTQQPRLTGTLVGSNDQFGNAVALSGGTALIGSHLSTSADHGFVYVFERGAFGWNYSTILTPNSVATDKHFGTSVALDGDTALIGASIGLFPQSPDHRSAYVFVRLNNSWRQIRQFGPELGTPDDRFGYSVALDGDTVMVGAYRSDAAATDQGAAYAFVLHDSQHIEQQKLAANDGASNDYFGSAIALDGDTLAVGADEDNIGLNLNQGSVYVFTRDNTGWVFQQKITANDGAMNDFFGKSVALSGDTLAVGANLDDIGTNQDQGSAYIFTRSGNIWTFEQKLTAVGIDGLPGDNLGAAVALSGQTVAVGAPRVDGDRGATYIFTRSGTTWTQQAKLTISGIGVPAFFGAALALSGDIMAVGAPFDGALRGSVYVFNRSGATWTPKPKITASDASMGNLFGSSLALGDNLLFIGAPDYTAGTNTRQGTVYLFQLIGQNWNEWGKFFAFDAAAEDKFGSSVALNNNILVIGAPGDNIGLNNDQGSAHFYNYIGGQWNWQKKLTAGDGAASDGFGNGVAVGGDAVVSGARADSTETNTAQGAAYVFLSPVCPATNITPAGLPNGLLGAVYNQQLSASGNLGGYQFTLSGGALPPGLALNNGTLNGTPTAAGTYRFKLTATYSLNLCSGSQEYALTILENCPTLTVSPSTMPNGTVGVAYNQTVMVTGGATPYTFSLNIGSTLPPGLSFINGVLSGTPTQAGTFSFLARIRDANNCLVSQGYSVTIGAGNCPIISVNPATLPTGRADEVYSQNITQTGGNGVTAFAITSGLLPGGLTLSTSGLLSGAPTAFGDFNFTVTATDANGCTGLRAYSLHINQPCGTLILNPTSLPEGMVGAVYNQTVTATGGTAPYAFTVSAGTLPNGLSLAANGALTGTPNISGVFNFTVKATDTNGCVGTRAYSVGINGLAANNVLQYYPLPRPIRLFDTRAPIPGFPACAYLSQPLTAGQELERSAHISCDNITIPSNARAIVGNATVTGGQANGFITIWPGGQQRPPVSNLNFVVGQTVPNAFTVGLSGDGKFRMYSPATTDLIVDIVGYYAPPGTGGLYYHPLPHPIRLFDTRAPIPGFPACAYLSQPLIAGQELERNAHISCDNLTIPNDAMALVGNVTATGATGNGFLSMWPSGQSRPAVSSLNFVAGQSVPNAFTVGLSSDGKFKLYATHATDLIIDIAGYYSSSPIDANGNGLLYTPLDKPIRLFDTRAPIQGFPACQYLNSPLVAGVEAEHQARVSCDGLTIPTSALAIVGNATVTSPAGNGYVTLWPNGQARPPVSNLNYVGGQTIPNAFTVGLGSDGKFRVVSVSNTHFIMDVTGYFAP